MKNRYFKNRNRSADNAEPIGTLQTSAPATNRGGKWESDVGGESNVAGANRHRISLSVPAEIKFVLESMSSATGLSLSQVALSAILSGLPVLGDQVKVIRDCDCPK